VGALLENGKCTSVYKILTSNLSVIIATITSEVSGRIEGSGSRGFMDFQFFLVFFQN